MVEGGEQGLVLDDAAGVEDQVGAASAVAYVCGAGEGTRRLTRHVRAPLQRRVDDFVHMGARGDVEALTKALNRGQRANVCTVRRRGRGRATDGSG